MLSKCNTLLFCLYSEQKKLRDQKKTPAKTGVFFYMHGMREFPLPSSAVADPVNCPGQRQMLVRICRRSLRKFPAENFLVRFCPFDSLFTFTHKLKTHSDWCVFSLMHAVVEEVITIFENKNEYIYIPDLRKNFNNQSSGGGK